MNTSGNCEICGSVFTRQSAGGYRKRFCSKKCSAASSNAKWNAVAKDRRHSIHVIVGNCKFCDKPFDRPVGKTGRRQIYCDDNCLQKQWALDHPAEIKARRQRVYAKSGDKIRAKALAWNKAHPEENRAKQRAWSKTENGKLTGKAGVHRRRARIMGNGGSFTRAEFKALCAATGNVCLCCRKPVPFGKLEADHIVALVNGGDNSIGNIQPLCRHCNADKGKTTINFILDYALEGMVLNDPSEYSAFQGAAA